MINTSPIFVAKKKLYLKLNEDINKFKILYICTPTGWGKTTVISEWLKENQYTFDFITVNNQDNIMAELRKIKSSEGDKRHIIIIDDFHKISSPVILDELVDYISSKPMTVHFILIGRTEVNPQLKPYVITRQLQDYGTEDFRFSYEECVAFFEINNIYLTEEEINFGFKSSMGYPISLNSIVKHLQSGNGKLTEEIIHACRQDLFDYYDSVLFNKWEPQIQDFVIKLAGLNNITPLLAQMVTLNPDSKDLLEKCCSIGSFITFSPPETYVVHQFISKYLIIKQRKLLDEDEVKTINHYAGNYYEMIGNHTEEALKYYSAAGEIQKVKKILTDEAARGGASGKFVQLEPYFLSLNEDEILSSPLLCSAMAMLHSICCRSKESEYWFDKLLEMRKIIPKKTATYRILEEQIAYLSIALPHTGSSGLIVKLATIAKAFSKNGFHMQEISITGNMPSLMHGGKDFCEWSKSAEHLRKMLKGFLEIIFISDGIGLADTGVGEAFYEQNKLDSALIELTKGTTDSRNRGTVEMLFAGTAVLARILIAKGEYKAAINMMDGIKEKITEKDRNHLIPNFNAFMVRLKLLVGEMDSADKWCENEAPDENLNFYTTERYRYMTKVRTYLLNGKYTQAEILLIRLKQYFSEYSKDFEYMEATLLEAILYFKTEDERWVESFNQVLIKAQGYNFIRIIADEGAAVYPLLLKIKKDEKVRVKAIYLDKLMVATKKQATFYPDYLKSKANGALSLTNTEVVVLRLLSQGKKYREIEGIMNISSNTVKFHIKNIYGKFGASGKCEAVDCAKKLKII